MVTRKNYFKSSIGTFKVIPASWTQKLLAAVDSGREYVRLGNRTFTYDYYSYNERYECISIYFVDTEERQLIRVSDHWCKTRSRIITERLDENRREEQERRERERLGIKHRAPRRPGERYPRGSGLKKEPPKPKPEQEQEIEERRKKEQKRLYNIARCRWYLAGRPKIVDYREFAVCGGIIDFSTMAAIK